jgi:hypothetical protein
MRRVLPLVVAATVFLAGCGQSNPELIPQSSAEDMIAAADQITPACEASDRSTVRRQLRVIQREIDGLPRATDAALKENLQAWADRLEERVTRDCADEEPEETPTPTETPTETATPEETPTETATPEDTPTAEPTQAPTEEPTAAPTQTPAPTEAPPVPTATPEVP